MHRLPAPCAQARNFPSPRRPRRPRLQLSHPEHPSQQQVEASLRGLEAAEFLKHNLEEPTVWTFCQAGGAGLAACHCCSASHALLCRPGSQHISS